MMMTRWLALVALTSLLLVSLTAPTQKTPSKSAARKDPEKKEPTVKKPSTEAPKKGSTPKGHTTKPKKGTSHPKAPKNSTATPTVEKKCSNVHTAISSIRGIGQNCTVHDDCLGACCKTEILGHPLFYNFSVMPCEKPSVELVFKISDINGSVVTKNFLKSETVIVPKGNMSYTGMTETESKIVVTLDKTQEITHFRLDFGVDYRVLKGDPLKSLFSHTLVPMLSLQYNKKLCAKPTEPPKIVTKPHKTEGDNELIYGIIPKDMVEDKTKLALIITAAALALALIIGVVYFIIARNRDHGYRTYVSTDENIHLTKGNDGFEPLDDSDID